MKLVNLSNTQESKSRNASTVGANAYYATEYRGQSVIERAKKVARLASFNNPQCWYIYDYIYKELTWRNKK